MDRLLPPVKRLSTVNRFCDLVELLEQNWVVAGQNHWKREQWLSRNLVYLGRVVEIDAVVDKSEPEVGHSRYQCLTCRIVPVTKRREELGTYRVVCFGDTVSELLGAELSLGSMIALFNPLKLKNHHHKQHSCLITPQNSSVWICDAIETSDPVLEYSRPTAEFEKETGGNDFRDDNSSKPFTDADSVLDPSDNDDFSLRLDISKTTSEGILSTVPEERLCRCTLHKCKLVSPEESCACVRKNIVCCCSNNKCFCCCSNSGHFPVGLQCCVHSKCFIPPSCQKQCQCHCHCQHSVCSNCNVQHNPKPNAEELGRRMSPSGELHSMSSKDKVEFGSCKRKKQSDELSSRRWKRKSYNSDCDEAINEGICVVPESDSEMELVYPSPEKKPKDKKEPKSSEDKVLNLNTKLKKCLVRIERLNKIPSTSGIKVISTEGYKFKNDEYLNEKKEKEKKCVDDVLQTSELPHRAEVKKDASHCSAERKENVQSSCTWYSSKTREKDLPENRKEDCSNVKDVVDNGPSLKEKEQEVIVHRLKYLVMPDQEPKELVKCQVYSTTFPTDSAEKSKLFDQKKFKKVTNSVVNKNCFDAVVQSCEPDSQKNPKNLFSSVHAETANNNFLTSTAQVTKAIYETENCSHRLSESSSVLAVETQVISSLPKDTLNNSPNVNRTENLCGGNLGNGKGELKIVSDDVENNTPLYVMSQFSDASILTQENILIMSPLDQIHLDNSEEINVNKRECNKDEGNLNHLNQTRPEVISDSVTDSEKQELTKNSSVATPVKHSQSKDCGCQNKNKKIIISDKESLESSKMRLVLPKREMERLPNQVNILAEKCSPSVLRSEALGVSPSGINNFNNCVNNRASISFNGFDESSDEIEQTQVVNIPNCHFMKLENSVNSQSLVHHEPNSMNHVTSEDSLESPTMDSVSMVREKNEILSRDLNAERVQEDEELELSETSSEDEHSADSVSDLSVDLTNGSNHILYTLSAFVQGMEPDLTREKPFDLVSGHCPGCQRFIPYSQLICPENVSQLHRLCTVCFEQGKTVETKLVYFFTIKGVDETGNVVPVLISRSQAQNIVGVPVDVYLSSDELAWTLWSKAVNYFKEKEAVKEKFHIPVIIRKHLSGFVVMLSGEIQPANS